MKRVLIADDQPSLRMLVSATLAAEDLEVVEAADGDEAWRMMRACQPELALLDVQMPGRDGLELSRAIRADKELAGTHIILLTSKALAADVEAGLAAGANRYMTKPFSPLELLEEVQAALGIG